MDFERAYSAWRQRPFPEGSRIDPLDELHADLVLADTWVAQTIIPFVEDGRYHPAQVDVLGKLQEIRDGAAALGKSGVADEKRLAREYLTYAELLRTAYESFLKKVKRFELSFTDPSVRVYTNTLISYDNRKGWCPRQDLNLCSRLRRPVLYPG